MGRAVDNQVYFSMCSPARDLTAGYHAVSFRIVTRGVSPLSRGVSHHSWAHRGSKLVEAEDGETILRSRIGK